MKKVNLLLAASLLFCIISCNKEIELKPIDNPSDVAVEAQLKEMTFYATADKSETDTKTALDAENDHIINWTANETIYVFDGTAPRSFTNGTNVGSTGVPFTGAALESTKYYALFPSGFFVKGNGTPTITATIPVSQTATAGSFDPKANVSIAVADDKDGLSTLSFKNVGAVVKFTLQTAGVRKVVLESRGTEKIAGEVSITLDDSNIPTAAVTTGSSIVILDGKNADLSVDTPYYITVLPGTYASGLKITFEKSDGKYKSFSNKNSQTLSRGGLMNFGEFTISSFKDVKVDNLNLAFTGVAAEASYDDWTATGASGAEYAGQTAGNYSSIQLTNGSPKGIVSTTSGGKARKVVVQWNSNTTADRTLDIYGKNSAYTDGGDLYNNTNKGTLLGSIVKGTSTELLINGNYEYIGLRSNKNAMYLDKISITWDAGTSTPTTPSTTITNVTNASLNEEGGVGSFIITSNVHWTLSYSPDGNSDNVTYASEVVEGKTQINVTFPSMTGAAGACRSVVFTVTPESGDPVNQTFTQTVRPGITWNSNGSTTTTHQTAGETVVLPSEPTLSGYTFRGWTAATTVNSDESSIVWITDSSIVPETDVTYYAVYKLASPSGVDDDGSVLTWTAVESAVKYLVTIDSEDPVEVATNSYDFSELSLSDGSHSASIVAVPAAANLFVNSSATIYNIIIGSASLYNITVSQTTGGTITVNGSNINTSAAEGSTVTLAAVASSTHKFTSWSVTMTVGGAAVDLLPGGNSFIMPAGAVTVSATFTAKKWVLVTDASTLNDGDIVTLGAYAATYNSGGKSYTDYKVIGAISGTIASAVEAENSYSNAGSIIDALPDGAVSYVLHKSGTKWTLVTSNKYLYYGAKNSLGLRDDSFEWSLSITDSVVSFSDNSVITKGTDAGTYTIQYNPNSGNGRFAAYKSSQKGIRLYRYE